MPLGRRGACVLIAAALMAGLVYLNALHNPFVYDDFRTVVDNGSIARLTDWRAVVIHDLTRPLANVSFAIDRAVWGPSPFGFHLTNVLLHAVNAALLALLIWRLSGDRPRALQGDASAGAAVQAFVGAGLFAVHPMMTEAVGYISGRSDVLAATCCLASLLTARHWMLGGGARWWISTVALWVAGLVTKETAAMLPFVALAVDRLVLPGTPEDYRRRWTRLHLPLMTIAMAIGLARVGLLMWVEHPGESIASWSSVAAEFDAVRRYLGLLIAPRGQTIFHDVAPASSVFEAGPLIGMVMVALLLVWAWRARRRAPIISLGAIWFLLLLVPSAMLVVLGQGEAIAEHRVYLASAGVFAAAGAMFGLVSDRIARDRAIVRWLMIGVAGSVLLSLAGRTLFRNAIWSSPVEIWREAVDRAPRAWLPREVLAESLHDAGRHDEAIDAYRSAIRLSPKEPLGYFKLSICLAERQRFAEAVAALDTLRQIDPQSPVVPAGMGAVALMGGDVPRARQYLTAAIAADPRDVLARPWLATLEGDFAGNPAAALRICEEIQRITPGTLANDECLRKNRSRLGAAGSR